MDVKKQIEELKKQGVTIYSISRLNTVDECGYEYWQTYINHQKGVDNIYSFLGSRIHKCLENLQNGINVDLSYEVKSMIDEAKFLDINFPSESIGNKWENDMLSFASHYQKPIYDKVETEKLFLVELDGHYLEGIIDLLIYNDDGTVSIRDYKTSSKFTNSNLEEKGRQLILYGLAMEQLGYKVKDVAWEMLKYVEITYKLKNGKTKSVIAERGYVIDKLKSDIKRELKKLDIGNEKQTEELLQKAIEKNTFDILPKQIKEKYNIKDYIYYYDFTEERKRETRAFIDAKIGDIENFKDDKEWWEAKEITPYTSFYCKNLCNHRDKCEYLQDFLFIDQQYNHRKFDEDVDEELKKFI